MSAPADMASAPTIQDILARWDSGDGKPYKGSLIDWQAYEADPANIGCMCAQGQVLHLYGGWEPQRISDTDQEEADLETAHLLNISRAHAILLRDVNDRIDGAPSIVLTDPGKVLGDQWSKLLDFWWVIHVMDDAAWAAAGDAARDAAWSAAGAAAGDAAWAAAGDAAWAAAGAAAGAAAWSAAWAAAAYAANEIQGAAILKDRGIDPLFLPIFGFATADDIPARPADYGLGVVPAGEAA